jgi:hypothetical protein
MSKIFVKWPDIDQLRSVVREVQRKAGFMGLDENGDPIIDHLAQRPTITFHGSVKLHGTNAGVSYNLDDGMWAQSREHIISVGSDNAGFAAFVENNKGVFSFLIAQILLRYNDHMSETEVAQKTAIIYGEWAGKGIQTGVAISQVEKAFYIFGARIINLEDENDKGVWVDHTGISSPDNRIFNVTDYPTYSISIDFGMPENAQNELIKLTEAVEAECPIGKAMGVEGVGEGIVWVGKWRDETYRFKVKGIKHSVSKVKTLAAIDTDRLNSITEFVEYAVTPQRFSQALEKVFTDPGLIDVKRLGEVIKWMNQDIIKEESDTLVDNNLEMKDVGKYIADRTKKMFFEAMTK